MEFKNFIEWLNEATAKPGLTPEQVEWCNNHIREKWSLNSRGEVEVTGNLTIKLGSFTRFPVQFANVKGWFSCYDCTRLTTLKGAPQEVRGSFNCNGCTGLTSLEGAPQEVGGDFYCRYCTRLTSLKGAPWKVEGNFNCGGCTRLTSLEGAPQKVERIFGCSGCTHLTTLKGAPEVGGWFRHGNCPKIPQEEIDFLENTPDLFYDWMRTGLSLGEYKEKYKGKITGNKFGL